MLKKTSLALAIALAPSLALAATGTTRDFAPVSEKAAVRSVLSTLQVRDMLASQGVIEIDNHGVRVDRVNPIGDDTPLGARQLSAEPHVQGRGGD